jgi:glutathionylspermidine synthase
VRPSPRSHQHLRKTFFATRFPEFAALADDHAYALFDAHVVTTDYIERVRQAAADAWSIYRKIFPVLQALPDETLEQMGFPANVLKCVRLRYAGVPETVVGRFDFIVTPSGPKLIELNAETPFFYWESNCIAGAIARALGYDDPNENAEQCLKDALAAAVLASSRGGRIVVTAHADDTDDSTGLYATRALGEALGKDVDFSTLDELFVIPGEALYDSKGPIDVLYRFYPLELFSSDEGGDEFFALIASDKLRIINPPCSLLLQNKCAQVLIWGLYEDGAFFSESDRAIIERVFLPTYADLPDDGNGYVRKPVFGRHGTSVAFVDDRGTTGEAPAHDYDDQPMVYQRRVPLPTVAFEHPTDGQREGYAITTCFIVGGTPTAVCMRVGDEITDAWAHFLPLAYSSTRGTS